MYRDRFLANALKHSMHWLDFAVLQLPAAHSPGAEAYILACNMPANTLLEAIISVQESAP